MNPKFRPPSGAYETKGHADYAPGLRGHSVGDLYPWTIVVYQTGDCPKMYRAENLLTGEKGTPKLSYADAEAALQRALLARHIASRSIVDAESLVLPNA